MKRKIFCMSLVCSAFFFLITSSFVEPQQTTAELIEKEKQLRPKGKVKRKFKKLALKSPTTLGKTHFIVGFPHEEFKIKQEQAQKQALDGLFDSVGSVKKAFFSPDDNLEKALVDLIKSENHSIKVAIYSFTNRAIAESLLNAHNSGIRVEVITDPSALYDPFNKIELLRERGIPVYVYKPTYNQKTLSDRMHDKFIIFDKNIENKALIWTGSANLTRSATINNQENVVLLDDQGIIEQFNQQFVRLKERCIFYDSDQKILGISRREVASRKGRKKIIYA